MSTKLIDLRGIESGVLRDEPFTWAVLNGLVGPAERRALAEHFPRDGFESIERNKSGKNYRMDLRPLIKIGQHEGFRLDDLHPIWRRVCDEILSPDYRRAVESLTQVDLGGCVLEATFWRYCPSCFLSPHTDEAEKSVTQLFYFNKDWDASRGGGLDVYAKDLSKGPVVTVSPNDDTSVVLVRSDDSWHGVPIVDAAYGRDRISLQIVFWNEVRYSKRAYVG